MHLSLSLILMSLFGALDSCPPPLLDELREVQGILKRALRPATAQEKYEAAYPEAKYLWSTTPDDFAAIKKNFLEKKSLKREELIQRLVSTQPEVEVFVSDVSKTSLQLTPKEYPDPEVYFRGIPVNTEFQLHGSKFWKPHNSLSPFVSKQENNGFLYHFANDGRLLGYFLPPGARIHGSHLVNRGTPKIFFKSNVKRMTIFHEEFHLLRHQQRESLGQKLPSDPLQRKIFQLGEELDNYRTLFDMRNELGLTPDEVKHQVISHRNYLELMRDTLSLNESSLRASGQYDRLMQRLQESLSFQQEAESHLPT